MVSIPFDLFALAFIIVGMLVLLFFDVGYTVARIGWRGHCAVLAGFAVSLAALALLPNWDDPLDLIIAPSVTVLFAFAIAILSLRNGHLDQCNPPRAAAFALAAVYLTWAGLALLQTDFVDAWPDVDFRTHGGKSSWMDATLVYLGKLLQWLGNEAAAIPAWTAAALAARQALRLSRRPDSGRAAQVMAVHCQAEALPPVSPTITADPNPDGTTPAFWWNRHPRGSWDDPDCRALLRVYSQLGGPYIAGAGIRLRDGYLQPDAGVMVRLLDGGGLRFGAGSDRFALTSRGRALMQAPPGSDRR